MKHASERAIMRQVTKCGFKVKQLTDAVKFRINSMIAKVDYQKGRELLKEPSVPEPSIFTKEVVEYTAEENYIEANHKGSRVLDTIPSRLMNQVELAQPSIKQKFHSDIQQKIK